MIHAVFRDDAAFTHPGATAAPSIATSRTDLPATAFEAEMIRRVGKLHGVDRLQAIEIEIEAVRKDLKRNASHPAPFHETMRSGIEFDISQESIQPFGIELETAKEFQGVFPGAEFSSLVSRLQGSAQFRQIFPC
jgi:hypothetical protein